jgi:hypothetical protein
MVRPQKEIDWAAFENLCQLQCTQSEIASFLKVHIDTLRDRAIAHYEMDDYSNIYKKFSESGKCSLRRNQFVLSKKNASMAIWLGKIWLGQRDVSREAEQVLNTIATKLLEHIDPSRELIPTGSYEVRSESRPSIYTPSTSSE